MILNGLKNLILESTFQKGPPRSLRNLADFKWTECYCLKNLILDSTFFYKEQLFLNPHTFYFSPLSFFPPPNTLNSTPNPTPFQPTGIWGHKEVTLLIRLFLFLECNGKSSKMQVKLFMYLQMPEN